MPASVPDEFDCGCECVDETPRFLTIVGDEMGTATWCFRTGWRDLEVDGADHDWILVAAGAGGAIDVTMEARYATDLLFYTNTGYTGAFPEAVLNVDECTSGLQMFSAVPDLLILLRPHTVGPVAGVVPA